MISIIIPSHGRADRIAQVVDNIHYATHGPHEILVVVEDEDWQPYSSALGEPGWKLLIKNRFKKNYAGAINTAVSTYVDAEYLFMGADDILFSPGWDDEAMAVMNALDTIKVVGTNDELNAYVLRGVHSTHSLVSTAYLQDVGGVVDQLPPTALYEGYDHNYVDTEFIGTAKMRAVFAPCLRSIVRHNHFTAGRSARDATYDKGYANINEDSRLYEARQPLWMSISR